MAGRERAAWRCSRSRGRNVSGAFNGCWRNRPITRGHLHCGPSSWMLGADVGRGRRVLSLESMAAKLCKGEGSHGRDSMRQRAWNPGVDGESRAGRCSMVRAMAVVAGACLLLTGGGCAWPSDKLMAEYRSGTRSTMAGSGGCPTAGGHARWGFRHGSRGHGFKHRSGFRGGYRSGHGGSWGASWGRGR